jgi:fumarylacetoacetate (FAA) hydrolase
MRLATSRTRSRDGCLVVVDRAMRRVRAVPWIARTLQETRDHWAEVEFALKAEYADLCASSCGDGIDSDPVLTAAPLPRAYHWVDGGAYVNHVELVRKARGAEMPESFWHDPLVYQGGSDDL